MQSGDRRQRHRPCGIPIAKQQLQEVEMPGAIGNAGGVDLNSASEQELECVGGLGRERAQRIIQQRPFNSWDDVKKIRASATL